LEIDDKWQPFGLTNSHVFIPRASYKPQDKKVSKEQKASEEEKTSEWPAGLICSKHSALRTTKSCKLVQQEHQTVELRNYGIGKHARRFVRPAVQIRQRILKSGSLRYQSVLQLESTYLSYNFYFLVDQMPSLWDVMHFLIL